MKNRNRGIYDYAAEVCNLVADPVTLSEIVVAVRLGRNYRKVLDKLVASGLIVKDGKCYRTTEKGQEFLNVYDEIQILLGETKVD